MAWNVDSDVMSHRDEEGSGYGSVYGSGYESGYGSGYGLGYGRGHSGCAHMGDVGWIIRGQGLLALWWSAGATPIASKDERKRDCQHAVEVYRRGNG
jgi:hypothetical protein